MLEELKAKAATLEEDKALPSTNELERYFKLAAPIVPEEPKAEQPPPDANSTRVPIEPVAIPEVAPVPPSESPKPPPASSSRAPTLENPSEPK